MRTSYYTGYKDLDNKLVKLYDMQTRAEINGEDTRRIIEHQNALLNIGKQRDKEDKKS